MKIAVASGKGGTGKTTVATSLALSAAGLNPLFLDCDVEAPNSHIFLKPEITSGHDITLRVPVIKEEQCTFCGKCREICRFNAITIFGNTIMAFTDMCHACGGCFLVCQDNAIEEERRLVGTVNRGAAGHEGDIPFVSGTLRVGEAMAVPLIEAVKREAGGHEGLVILDAPPGTSCPVVATVRDADFCLLVTEPTPFGLHDLKIAVAVMRRLDREFGVVINRADLGNDEMERWCEALGVRVLLKIPFSREIARNYAEGIPLVKHDTEMKRAFSDLLVNITEMRGGEA
jgi:MinD superfamily P-loop ATPase